MTRAQRLERWADLLEPSANRLSPLPRIEDMSEDERRQVRGNSYPMAVAFADPVFRELGLKSDRLGDAMEFFALNARDVHALMCECMGPAAGIPHRLRHHAKRAEHPGLWRRFLLATGLAA
ncbi:hypothetical protein [Lutibaculum baratangense]|nr:hypothetical protein [Lutibaculum baratangense]